MRLSQLIAARPMVYSDQVFARGGSANRLKLRPYAPGDEAALNLREDFRVALDAAGGEIPAGLRWTIFGGTSWEERPIAIGGLEPWSDGKTWGAWALTNDLTRRQWAFARLAAARVLAFAERSYGARRIEAMAVANLKAVRLLRTLGFSRSGRQLRGPDGKPYIHMVREF